MAAKTLAAGVKPPHLIYMSAWFCPFAHRATLALQHHKTHLTYEWVEALGWEKRVASDECVQTAHENWYHFKAPELMKWNPLGMVPTLVSEASFKEDPSLGPMTPAVRESLVAIEFVDELVRGGETPIMPSCPYERARDRVAAEAVNKTVCSKYYHVLVRQEAKEQREGFDALVKGLDVFGEELAGGPFFAGRSSPGLVDYALFPWAHRLPVFEHYRGATFAIPRNTPGLLAYHGWLKAMESLPHVRDTCPPWADYLAHIGRYADGSARSKVANAVRDGRDAHQYDDDKDDTSH
mmetsp:Transcript_7480/g.18564  ORF Transcript_7480/g.18564 Transcript_7480/m.18564 type:complete len:294 (-) Transcript_7480:89-970(-)